MAKLSAKEMAIAYTGATVATAAAGAVGGYLWQHYGGQTDYVAAVGIPWLVVVGGPSMFVARDRLMVALGQRQPTTVTATAAAGPGRRIPFTAAGGTKQVLMSVLPFSQPDPDPIELPEQFAVSIAGTAHTIMLPQIQDFLYASWKRQRRGLSAFSRKYWLAERRPDRLKRQTYDAVMTLLLSVDGLIVDRDQRRSGRLAVPPQLSIKAIQGVFALG